MPLITGAHLCLSDADAFEIKTAESRDRADVQAPPNWFMLIEACTVEAIDVPIAFATTRPELVQPNVGRYAMEYARLKTDWTPG